MAEPTKTPKKTRVKEERHIPLDPSEENEPSEGKKLSLGRFSPVILPLILALAVSYFLITVMAVPKGTYNNAIMGLTGRVVNVETSVEEVVAGQEAISASIKSLEEELANFDLDTGEIDALAVKVNSIEAQVAGLDISSINDKLDAFNSAILYLEDAVEALEPTATEPDEEEDPTVTAETTRWTFRDYQLSTPSYSFIEYDLDCDKVEEEGLYEIELVIENTSDLLNSEDPKYNLSANLSNAVLRLVLQPREYTPINEEQTYLDSDDAPWLSWDADFVIKPREGKEVCRRITFTSAKQNLGSLAPGQSIQLDLILELYYK